MAVEEMRAGGMLAVISVTAWTGHVIWVTAGIPPHQQATLRAAGRWGPEDAEVEAYGDGGTSGISQAWLDELGSMEPIVDAILDGYSDDYGAFEEDLVNSVRASAIHQWWEGQGEPCTHCGSTANGEQAFKCQDCDEEI